MSSGCRSEMTRCSRASQVDQAVPKGVACKPFHVILVKDRAEDGKGGPAGFGIRRILRMSQNLNDPKPHTEE